MDEKTKKFVDIYHKWYSNLDSNVGRHANHSCIFTTIKNMHLDFPGFDLNKIKIENESF